MSMCNLYHAVQLPCRLTAFALFLAMATGCGSGKTAPVGGKVVFKDGTPLTAGQVVFRPVDEKLQVSARGDIEQDGTFILGTYKDGDGAVPGKYQALINPPPRPKKREKAIGKPIIDPRFSSYETSGLEFEVTNRKNDFTIVVDKP
jgi:hypothetical protein